MHTRAPAWTIATLVTVTVLSATASAQWYQPPAYQPPAGAVVTPYLGFYSLPSSPLVDNYHDSTRARAEVQGGFNRLGTALGQQSRRLGELQEDLQVHPSGAAPTGNRSTFQNLSHYYGGLRSAAHAPPPSANRGNAGSGVGRGAERGMGAGGRGAYRRG